MLFTAMAASDVVRHKTIDVFDPTTQHGYQRSPSPTRVNAAARYYGEKRGHMPNALLVNIRKDDFGKVTLHVQDRNAYDDAVATGGDWIGTGCVDVPDDLDLWVYDGQHRGDGVEVDVKTIADFGSFPVPLSVTLGLSDDEELKEFYDVNTNAKSVRTDLAWQLLKTMADASPEFAERLELEGKDWVTRGIAVVDDLVKLDGPWKDRIQAPNQKARRSDALTIPQAQFVRSLRPVLEMPFLSKAEPTKIAQLLNAYWLGIARVLPEPFVSGVNPKEFAIQKGQGTVALHRVLPQAIEVVRSRGQSLGDSDAFAEVMEQLPQLKGEVVTEDGSSEVVSGAMFWRSGSAGVASQFTGDAGRKRLSVRIRSLMPRPADELVL